MGSFKLWLIGGFILFCLTGAAGIALMGLSGWFISAAAFAGLTTVTAANFNYLLPGAGVRLFAFIRILARYGERIVNHQATFHILANIRTWLFKKLSRLSPLQLTIIKNGSLLNRFISDVESLDNLFLRVLTPFFSCLILLFFITLMLCYFNMQIAIFTFIATIFMLILLFWLMLKLGRKLSKDYNIALTKLRETITFSCEAIKEITIFNAIDTQTKYVDTLLSLISQKQLKLAKSLSFAQAVITLFSGSVVIITLVTSIMATLDHHLNGANIALIILSLFAFYELLQPLPMALLSLGKTEHAAQNITNLTQIKPLFIAPEHNQITLNNFMLNIKQLSFNYDKTTNYAINNLSLDIPFGEHVIISGASGTGKTTLINLIARFMTPTAGVISIGQDDLYTFTEQQWHDIFCIIPQQSYLFDTTLKENLLLANMNATDDALWHALDICQLKSFVASLPAGLNTYVGKNGEHFSGGQAKRVALARAVLKNARITILDEPTEGLDATTERQLMLSLKQFFKNKTFIVASHRPVTVASFERRISL